MVESYVALALAATLLRGVGQTLQKSAAAQSIGGLSFEDSLRSLRSWSGLTRNSTWVVGTGMMLAGSVCGVQALADGDITVVVPIFGLSMAISIVLGIFVLREQVAALEWLAIGMMLAAGALVAFDAPATGLIALERSHAFSVGIGTSLAAAAVLGVRRLPALQVSREIGYAVACGALLGTSDSFVKAATVLVRQSSGSFSVLDPATLGLLALEPIAYLVIATFFAGFMLEQLAYANGRVSVVLPLRATTVLSVATAFGAFVFHEDIGARRLLGIAVLVAGSSLLASSRQTRRPEPSLVPEAEEESDPPGPARRLDQSGELPLVHSSRSRRKPGT